MRTIGAISDTHGLLRPQALAAPALSPELLTRFGRTKNLAANCTPRNRRRSRPRSLQRARPAHSSVLSVFANALTLRTNNGELKTLLQIGRDHREAPQPLSSVPCVLVRKAFRPLRTARLSSCLQQADLTARPKTLVIEIASWRTAREGKRASSEVVVREESVMCGSWSP